MKVGTDGCLLGAWFDIENSKRILDIGAGTGLISIMAAQRCNAKITGIEIDAAAAARAVENVKNSPWNERIEIINSDLRIFGTEELFDTIVSNPPYFANSLKCNNEQRTLARHNDTLSPAMFFAKAKELLASNGKISLILPTELFKEWEQEAIFKGFTPTRITNIQTTPQKMPKRTLVEFQQNTGKVLKEDTLILESRPGVYSKEACDLLRDFYLKIE